MEERTSPASHRDSTGYPPPGYSPKTQNEPKKCFRIKKSAQKRTRNEPERTREELGICQASLLESARPLEGRKNEPKTNPNEPELLDTVRCLTGPAWKAWVASKVPYDWEKMRRCPCAYASTECRNSRGAAFGRRTDRTASHKGRRHVKLKRELMIGSDSLYKRQK